MNKVFSKQLIKWGIIPLILFLFGCLLPFFYIYRTQNSILVLVNSYGKKELSQWKNTELLKGEKIKGEFKSDEKNLGIIAVRFKTYVRINSDVLIFRIKEKGSRDWYYQNNYKVNQFQPDQLFTFGFPIIKNSANKIYQFEIESTIGQKGDAIAINTDYPVFVSKHKYSKEELLQNKKEVFIFSIKKIESLNNENLSQVMSDGSKFIPEYLKGKFYNFVEFVFGKLSEMWSYIGWMLMIIMYFTPLIIYILWHLGLKNYFSNVFFMSLIPPIFMLMSTFLLKSADIIILTLTSFWIFTIYRYKLDSIISLVFSLSFLVLCPILIVFGQEQLAESAGVWVFMFLLVGFGQQFLEVRNGRRNNVNLKIYLNNLVRELIVVANFVLPKSKKLLRYAPFCLVLIFLLFVYKVWFVPGIITGGDFWPGYMSMLDNIYLRPYAWAEGHVSGFGGSILPLLWLYVLPAVSNTILGNILRFNIEIIERLGVFYPFLITSVFSSSYFFKRLFPNISFWFLSPIIFVFNTYILMVVSGGQMAIALSYAMVPVTLYFFIRLINLIDNKKLISFKNIRYAIVTGLILTAQIMLEPRISYVAIAAVFIYIVFEIVTQLIHWDSVSIKFINVLSLILYTIVIPFSVVILLHAFWLLPTLIFKQNPIEKLGAAYSSIDAVRFFSFAKFEDTLSLLHPNWPENIFGKTYFMRSEFIILPILAFSSLLFINYSRVRELKGLKIKKLKNPLINNSLIENKIILYFALLGLIGVFLAKGANEPLGEVYLWLFKNIPGFQVFRDSTKWYVLVAISYSVLIPYSVWKVYEKLKSFRKFSINFYPVVIKSKILNFQNIFLVVIILYFAFLIRPAVMGQLGGTLQFHKIPDEYVLLESSLTSQKQFFRTLWIPSMQRFGYYSDNHPGISSITFFNISSPLDTAKKFLDSDTEKLLQESSIRYVVVPYDTEGEIFLKDRKYDEKQYKETIEQLKNIKWLKEVTDCYVSLSLSCSMKNYFGKIVLFEVSDPMDHFYIINPNANGLTSSQVNYKVINPTKYDIDIKKVNKGDLLVFSESFDKNWKITIGREIIDSQPYNKFLNSFVLPKKGSYNIILNYQPQKWVDRGVLISITTFISIIIFLWVFRKRPN